MKSRRHVALHRGGLALAFVVLVGASVWLYQNRYTLAGGMGSNAGHENPVMGTVPDFSLTERSGKTVAKSDLLGRFWVASFVFTRCATSCPVAVSELAKLQADLPEDVRLVSFSVDPEYDSPSVLADYAEKVGADVDRWLFLTGEKSAIYSYIREGFHLAVQQNPEPRPGLEVTHSPRFALVDPKGRIRGYYDSSNPDDLGRLRKDVRRLYKEVADTASSNR